MSKPRRLFCLVVIASIAFLQQKGTAKNDGAEAASSPPPVLAFLELRKTDGMPIAIVRGVFGAQRGPANRNGLSFVKSVAGITGLAARVRNLHLLGSEGRKIPFRMLADGEFLAEEEIHSWAYTVDLSPPSSTSAAHSSWVTEGMGVLMLNDLLPELEQERNRVTLSLKVPHGWEVSAEKFPEVSGFELPDSDGGVWFRASSDSVFLVGKHWREEKVLETPLVKLILSGEWHFTDAEAADMVRQVYSEYERRLGRPAIHDRVQVALARFPVQTRPGQWQAETRGNNVTIISSDMPFRTQSLQRLHEQLRHELFHLWIPNGVNLTGSYDWFYEGFALYQSLKLAAALNRIRFEDFVDTLSRAHTIDSAMTRKVSLIEASANRFGGNNTQIYARGMLVSFLCDLALLQRSKGKRSVEDILRGIFEKHRKPNEPTDGNSAVLASLKANPELVPIVEKYVTGTEKIDWAKELSVAGLEDSDTGPITKLSVKAKPNGRQKALLDKLGYNNWRKLSPNSR